MAHPSKNKKLEKLLETNIPEYTGGSLNEELLAAIRAELKEYDPGNPNAETYHPVVELAKLAISTPVEAIKLRANENVAQYLYPKVKAYEIKSKEDKTVNVNIKIAGYAQAKTAIEIEAEDIELEDEDDKKELDYNDFVLGKTDTKKLDS